MDYRGADGWLRLAIDGAGGRAAVTSVAVNGSGGDWQPLSHSWGATWEAASAPAPPLSFQVRLDGWEVGAAFGWAAARMRGWLSSLHPAHPLTALHATLPPTDH